MLGVLGVLKHPHKSTCTYVAVYSLTGCGGVQNTYLNCNGMHSIFYLVTAHCALQALITRNEGQ